MIITCLKCYKKFDINSNLIPENGRLLECGNCNHQWFFNPQNKENTLNILNEINNEKLEEKLTPNEENKKIKEQYINKEIGILSGNEERVENNDDLNKENSKKDTKLLNIIIVFIISFAALVILLDTFKAPISKIIPNIEFILYNLYESIKDIRLFFYDLI